MKITGIELVEYNPHAGCTNGEHHTYEISNDTTEPWLVDVCACHSGCNGTARICHLKVGDYFKDENDLYTYLFGEAM